MKIDTFNLIKLRSVLSKKFSISIKNTIVDAVRILLKLDPPITQGEFDLNTLPEILGKEDPIFLDIGCNEGHHTRMFIKLFKYSKVFSFEPDSRAQAKYRDTVKDNRAKLFDFAISDNDGTTKFHVSSGAPSQEWEKDHPEGWDLSGSIKEPKEHLLIHPWCTFDKSITIKTKKLDTWSKEEGILSVDFIWADVQGAEENLIKGGLQTLEKTRYFYTEYNNHELYNGQISLSKIRKLLPNFVVVYRFSNDVLLKNRNLI